VFVAEAPRPVLYLVSVVAGAGVTALEASFFALLAEATDGGRRGRAYGWVTSISSLGIVVGAIGASQLWERTGDVGLGLLMTAVALAFAAAFLLLYPRDRPERVPTD
jgi:MFS family permease